MRRVILLFGLLLMSPWLGGCGSDGLIEVTGTVTMDGEAVPEGDIIFRPEDPKRSAEAGKVKDGEFKLSAPPGKHKVEITASRQLPLPPGKKGMMGETTYSENYVPARYNRTTELTAEVNKGGSNYFTFDLHAKKK